jgi:sugar/nucleoside kinase (ribokinase family)
VLAVVGNLSIDRIEGGPPQIGGGPYHASRALRLLDARCEVVTRCADADRRFLVHRLAALGMPLHVLRGTQTTAFSFEYEGDTRLMTVDAVGDPWTPRDVRAVDRRVRWLHVAPLLRSDFPIETIAELARGRRLILDAHGLVRRPQVGPLVLDDDFDPEVLRYVTALKLAEEEAAIVGEVDVPERLVTLGSRGAIVCVDGRETHVPARRLPRDPTGAGDAFAAAYLVSRAMGHPPLVAARRATMIVGAALR